MASVVDLRGILTELISIFNTANTTTASTDLSNNLTTRVQKVLAINPEMLPIQASLYPYVSSYITSKTIVSDDIAKNQLSCKRRADIGIDIVGAVFNQNFKTQDEDPATRDINYLMENIELILRANESINSKVLFQRPLAINYYSANIDSNAHLRAGILSLKATIFY